MGEGRRDAAGLELGAARAGDIYPQRWVQVSFLGLGAFGSFVVDFICSLVFLGRRPEGLVAPAQRL